MEEDKKRSGGFGRGGGGECCGEVGEEGREVLRGGDAGLWHFFSFLCWSAVLFSVSCDLGWVGWGVGGDERVEAEKKLSDALICGPLRRCKCPGRSVGHRIPGGDNPAALNSQVGSSERIPSSLQVAGIFEIANLHGKISTLNIQPWIYERIAN